MYRIGCGVTQDYSRSLALFSASANKGYAPSQMKLGVAYLKGLGTSKDNAKAQFNLGLMYRSGEGAQQDYVKAIELNGIPRLLIKGTLKPNII